MSKEVHCKTPQLIETPWYLYIVENKYGHWYTGITTDVARRFAQHNAGKGAKALIGKGPLTLIFQTLVGTRSEASQLEYRVKQLTKQQKINWVKSGLEGADLHPMLKSL